MSRRTFSLIVLSSCLLLACAACQSEPSAPASGGPTQPAANDGKPVPGAANSPLPANAFKATISVPEPPSVIKRGEKVPLQVKVKNDGPVAWPAVGQPDHKYQVNLGNHWYDANEKALVNDDARSGLPHDIQPGEEVTLPLRVTAPAAPGEYILELDMVQEFIGWFKSKGGQTLKLKVKVE